MAVLTGTPQADEKTETEKFAPSSKFMETVEYDHKKKTLDITFHSGTKVRYTDVALTTFLSFKQSPTHDAFYSRGIKGNLPSVKLIDKSIGRNKSAPLYTVKKEGILDSGLKRKNNRIDRIKGTVNRAFGQINAAGISG